MSSLGIGLLGSVARSVGRRANAWPGLGAALLLCLAATVASGQSNENPLKPRDRSSPRAALETFLDSCDAIATFVDREYRETPTRAEFDKLIELSEIPVASLDLSGLSPAAREKGARAAVLSLYGVLNRIPLPTFDRIPDVDQLPKPADGGPLRWVIPDTEIALERVKSGPRSGQFLFSADTVGSAGVFYNKVRDLGYRRPVLLPGLKELVVTGGGWMIPYRWVQAMPEFLRTPLADQALWKWIGFGILLAAFVAVLWIAYRVSRLAQDRSPFLHAVAQLTLPVSVLVMTPGVGYLALVQINLIEEVGIAVGVAGTVIVFAAGAWLVWRLSSAVAEAIIASPKIGPESIDAHLIRVTARLLGISGSAALLSLGASDVGIPVYGIVAGLGVGGLAIALAAQPTIENLIGGLNLFADKPMRVGDFCKYGDDIGTVEAIGIRSTRIRGIERTLTTIPNAALAKMPIVNFTRRDRMLIQAVIGLRYETTPEQLRYVLVKLREMLLGHPRIDPDPARARLTGFGDSSLNVEVFAYVMTRDWGEFLGIREDVLLRIMDIVEQAGTAIAFPSRTLYLGRDHGPDDGRVEAAEATVRAWRDEGSLPFPNFSPEQVRNLRGSVAFPPPGSTAAAAGRPGTQAGSRRDTGPAGGAAGRGART